MVKINWDKLYKESLTPWRKSTVDLSDWLNVANVFSGHALDLGCGTGEYSVWLANHGFDVEGLDFSSEALVIAKQQSNKPHFQLWDLENLRGYKFKHKGYDLILDVKTFVFIKDKQQYLQTIKTKLRGVFILQVFLRNDWKPKLAVNQRSLKDLLQNNFSTVREISHKRPSLEFAEYYLSP